MFWLDEIVEDILKKSKKNSFLITDWMTPSGRAHIGSLRGVIIHDLIRRGLTEKGKKALFQFGFDDFDPLDGLPGYLDKKFEKYMGMPMSNIPAPDNRAKSFSEQYLTEFKAVFNKLGIEPKIVKTSELYKKGKFNQPIKVVLDHAEEIRKIYREVSGSQKGQDWYPFQIVCPKCGKIGTTKVSGWDGREVEFVCEKNLVSWAKGCGFQEKISPFNGTGKMPWKVEWPAKWFIFNTDIEGEGKDHFAAGGSRDIGNVIYQRVFQKEPPYDIHYEHFLVGGAKMSSSKGLGVNAKDMADFLPANVLRFLFVRTRYKKTIEFQPTGEAIPLLYDEYDRASADYFEEPESDLGRVFHFAQPFSQKSQPKFLLRFSKIAYILQMPRVALLEYAEKEKGGKLTEPEKQEIKNREQIAQEWLKKYAPENYRFEIQEKLPDVKLTSKQKIFLSNILRAVESKMLDGEKLHQKIHQIRKEMKIDPREAFAAIYLIFLAKDSGPQAGWFLTSLDKKFVEKRLREAVG